MPSPTPREKELPGQVHAGRHSAEALKQFFRKGPKDPCEQTKGEPVLCLCSPRRPIAPGGHQVDSRQGRQSLPSSQPGDTHVEC